MEGPSEGRGACRRGHCDSCGLRMAVLKPQCRWACVAITAGWEWEGRMESEVAPASWETAHTSGHQPLVNGRGCQCSFEL